MNMQISLITLMGIIIIFLLILLYVHLKLEEEEKKREHEMEIMKLAKSKSLQEYQYAALVPEESVKDAKMKNYYKRQLLASLKRSAPDEKDGD